MPDGQGRPQKWIDPTSRMDMEADLLRRWYEANRESFWDRRRKRWRYVADEFMLRFGGEAARIAALDDNDLAAEHGCPH